MAHFEDLSGGRVRASVCRLGVRDSGTFDSKGEAKKWAQIREGEILAGAKAKKAMRGKETLREAIERFRDEVTPTRNYEVAERRRCNALLIQLAEVVDQKIRTIESGPIQAWADQRERKVTGATVSRDLNFLSAVWRTAMEEWGWTNHNPVLDVEWPEKAEHRERRVPDRDRDAMLRALGYTPGQPAITERERTAVAFLVALGTGMRKGEICKVKRERRREFHIALPGEITKNGMARKVALMDGVESLLDQLPQDHELLFGGLHVDVVDRLFRAARQKAGPGVQDLHFHDSRHEFITRMSPKLPIAAMAHQVGHKDLNSLRHYYNATPEEVKELMQK